MIKRLPPKALGTLTYSVNYTILANPRSIKIIIVIGTQPARYLQKFTDAQSSVYQLSLLWEGK